MLQRQYIGGVRRLYFIVFLHSFTDFCVIQIAILNYFKDTVGYFNKLCCYFKLVLKSKDLQ